LRTRIAGHPGVGSDRAATLVRRGLGVAGVLAAGLIRGDLRARLALARVAEQQPPDDAPLLLVVTNLSSELKLRGETPPFPNERQRDVGGASSI
jgi:hypothetical protein